MATRSAFEVEPRLPASSLLLWASPAQAKQTLLQKRRRVDAPCVGFPSRRARVQAEPTSCRRSDCGWAAGKPVAGARHAVRRRCGSQGERLWLAKKVERRVSHKRTTPDPRRFTNQKRFTFLPPLPLRPLPSGSKDAEAQTRGRWWLRHSELLFRATGTSASCCAAAAATGASGSARSCRWRSPALPTGRPV